jgi:hypothetical protein
MVSFRICVNVPLLNKNYENIALYQTPRNSCHMFRSMSQAQHTYFELGSVLNLNFVQSNLCKATTLGIQNSGRCWLVVVNLEVIHIRIEKFRFGPQNGDRYGQVVVCSGLTLQSKFSTYNDHPWDPRLVTVVDRRSLFSGCRQFRFDCFLKSVYEIECLWRCAFKPCCHILFKHALIVFCIMFSTHLPWWSQTMWWIGKQNAMHRIWQQVSHQTL